MCGIAGFISKQFTEAQLKGMTDRLQHRGPDADGFFYDPSTGVGLGHRRLSIIDLSEAANQPFFSQDGRYVMIYNGEVYNYKEVELKYNIKPRTSSDTEIIIEAFAKAGIAALNDLNGMFTLIIWDKKEEALYLIRDRMGIKPLYYFENEGTLAFASELKAIFTLPFSRTISQDAINSFLYLGYIPGEATIYKECKKLKPGHVAIYKNGNLSIQSYWKIEDKIDPETYSHESIAKTRLQELIESSVKYCMISDVPLGVFLSGGIDSSMVAAAAQSVSDRPVKTFSIGFQEKKYNEAHFADEVARYVGTEHYEFIVSQNDALQMVDKLVEIYDEPYADSSAIPMLIVSHLARQHVTVALSGDGGDELFMGYGSYFWAERLHQPMFKKFRKPMATLLKTLGTNRLRRGGLLMEYPEDRLKSHIFSQEQYFFTEKELKNLVKHPGKILIEENLEFENRELSETEEQSFFDIKNYLPEELLVKADRASMHYSLEVRVPLLDHRLVEFALNVPDDMKIRGKTGKYLLKQVLYDYVPASLFDRPKWGFSIPLGKWLQRELKYLIDTYLSDTVVEECDLVNASYVRQLKADFFDGREYLYNRLWALILLHKWFKEKHQ